jgi:hypothetical protein
MHNYYKPGSWNVTCQVCGSKFKSDEVRKRWDGLIVCKDDYEDRHILDFARVQPKEHTVPFTAPEPDDEFIINLCVFPAMVGMADIGTADCAIAGLSVVFSTDRTMPIAGIAVASRFTPAKETRYD